MTLRDARRLHAVGAHGHRHRRLPLLPARPPPHRGRLPDRHVRQAGQRRRRPPRHLVHRAARTGGRGRGDGRRRRPGEGWTCFGGSGLRDNDGLNSAPWLGAWAPGGKESMSAPGFGKPLRGRQPDHHAGPLQPARRARPRRVRDACCATRPGSADITPLETVLLPAPVEMPCRAEYADGPLCDREASIADLIDRVGGSGNTNNALYFLCGGKPKPSNVTSCDRTIGEPTTIRARGRPHAPAGPVDQDRGQPGHARGEDHPRHPGLGLRQPGQPADRAGAASTSATWSG